MLARLKLNPDVMQKIVTLNISVRNHVRTIFIHKLNNVNCQKISKVALMFKDIL